MQAGNPHGTGIAWKRDASTIAYARGISFKRMQAILGEVAAAKAPYILHFRIATVGGFGKRLCHPFPVSTNLDTLFSKGGTTDFVFAHNGHWNDWDKQAAVTDMMLKQYRWSDSAVMAYLLALRGEVAIPDFQKAATLHVSRGLKTVGNFTEHEGYSCSNMFWHKSKSNVIATTSFGSRWWEDEYDYSDGPWQTWNTRNGSNNAKAEYCPKTTFLRTFCYCYDCRKPRQTAPIALAPLAKPVVRCGRCKKGLAACACKGGLWDSKGGLWDVTAATDSVAISGHSPTCVCRRCCTKRLNDARGNPTLAAAAQAVRVSSRLECSPYCKTNRICQADPCMECRSYRRAHGMRLSTRDSGYTTESDACAIEAEKQRQNDSEIAVPSFWRRLQQRVFN